MPNLRFPEFSGEWENSALNQFATKITKKNKGNILLNVLSNSANYGIIPQSDFFDRSIANTENTEGYYVISQNDFVYNPRKSTTAPYGPINIYEGEEDGIISPLYLCFKVNGIHKKFLYHFFKSPKWYQYIYVNGDCGVRHDRVSIKDDVFLELPVKVPSRAEQEKIAYFLNIIDERIETQSRIIEKLQSLMKGLNDYLQENTTLPYTLSFSEIGEEYSGLSGKTADDFGSGKPYITYVSVYSRTFVDDNCCSMVSVATDERQNVVLNGDMLFTLSSETPEEVCYGAVYNGNEKEIYLNSFCFGVRNTECKVYSPYMAYFFNSSRFRREVYPLAQGSTRFNLQKSDFLHKKFALPSKDEQRKIFKILNAYDNKIKAEELILVQYQLQKDFLLRSMFI